MKYLPVIIGVLLGTVIASAQSVQVQLHYTGSGTVDATHKIYVALWDSAGFMSDGAGPPMDVKGTTSKDGVVTFTDIQKSTVYVSTAYDPSGNWDAQSGPPKGSSLGMYSKKPPAPEPIAVAAGKTVKVTITFDDTAKAQ